MSGRALSEHLGLPSVRRFVESAADALVEGQSLVLLVPNGAPRESIETAVSGELQRRDLGERRVYVPGLRQDRPIPAALGEALGVTWPSESAPRTVSNLARCQGLPDVVWLDGISDLTPPLASHWFRFVSQWAIAAHARADAGEILARVSVVVPASACVAEPPVADTHVTVRWWWGIPSALEMQMLCRRLGDDEQTDVSHWRERVLPALAGTDVSLLDALWDHAARSAEEVEETLCAYANGRGWTADSLEDWGAGDHAGAALRDVGVSLAPPASARTLWSRGCLDYTPEHGLELHAAALALLGRSAELKHRLWRGQATLLLPVLDRVRLTLCRHLSDVYGPEWPVKWDLPLVAAEEEAVRADPLACEWGHLDALLNRCGDLQREAPWRAVASVAHRLRNLLAHYRPCAYREYAMFLDAVQQAQDMAWRTASRTVL